MSKYGKSATGFKLSPLQKTVGQPKFHRPPQRFPPARKAQSGVDPLGNFVSFMKSDPVPNIDIHKQIRKKTQKTDFTHLNDKWAVGTTKKFRSNTSDLHKRATLNAGINMISTKQPFRNPTDIISFNPPEAKKPFQKVYDKMKTDPGYKNNIQSKLGWADKMQTNETATLSMNNRSSVPHNIITHVDNTTSPVIEMGLLDHKVTNRKKGITEYADLSRVTALRNNEGHGEAYGGNINVFKRKTGIFTHMYDAAARHGNLNMPFGD